MAAEAEALPVAAAGTVEYVVQVRSDEVTDWQGEPCDTWRDITVVRVAPRTKRRTIITRALAQVEGRMAAVGAEPLQVRVLGPEDARPFKVSTVPRDPELRIEGV